MTQEQVNLSGLGYVEFDWDDDGTQQHAKWRRPNVRTYREMRNLLQDIGKKTNEIRTRRNQLLAWIQNIETGQELPDDSEPLPEDFDQEAAWEEIEDLRDQIADYTQPWMEEANRRLGDPGLPENVDEWPPWALNSKLASDILTHWRNVPLAPGAKGTNSPRKNGNE